MTLLSAYRIVLPLTVCQFLLGCASERINPAFPLTEGQADRDLQRMAHSPRRLDRPLVIVGGFLDPGFIASSLQQRFMALTGDDRVVAVAIGNCLSLEDCRRKIVEAVNRRFPALGDGVPDRPQMGAQTVEVDVIGCSLGGLAARYASSQDDDPTQYRLNIVRLFTISSPMRGSDLANELPLLHPIQKEVRPGSTLLARIETMPAAYQICSYIRLGDRVIGPDNASPPGQTAWWVDTPSLDDPHNGAFFDSRIVADIARRLRGERPFTTEPPLAPPLDY